MAKMYQNQGDPTKAHDYYARSLAAYEKAGSTIDTAICLGLLAQIAENPDDAFGYYNNVVEKFE
jgi:hypothetical protein